MEPAPSSKATRLTANHFAFVIHKYLASDKFRAYPTSTQRTWSVPLRRAANPETLGWLTVKQIRPALVQAFLDAFIDRPSAQVVALAALRQLERWAIVRDHLPHPITTGCEVEGSDGGHIPWTDDQVELGEHHARPEVARIITLASNTGQRGSDLLRMRWTDIDTFEGRQGILVTERKTKKTHWVPFTQQLTAALATWERRPGHILLDHRGLPWSSRDALSAAWAHERDNNPVLAPLRCVTFEDMQRPLVLHGLRGTACVRLLRLGANTREISDMIGMSEKMVARYTRFSEQKRNALAAVLRLDGTYRESAKLRSSKDGGSSS